MAYSSSAWKLKGQNASPTHGYWTSFSGRSRASHRRCWMNAALTTVTTPISFTTIVEPLAGFPANVSSRLSKPKASRNRPAIPPLHSLDLFTSDAYQQRLLPEDRWGEERMTEILKRAFPGTEKAAYETVWIPHFAFLGEERDIQEIAGAIGKIPRHASELWSS